MSHRPTMPIASTCAVLSCTPGEFWAVYENTTLSTSALAEMRALLLSAEPRYRLDELLAGMLAHAPHPAGARYASRLRRAAPRWCGWRRRGWRGSSSPVSPNSLLALSKAAAPAFEPAPAPAEGEDVLRDTVTRREAYHCAITHTFDQARARSLRQQGLPAAIPRGPAQRVMAVAHILPFGGAVRHNTVFLAAAARDAALDTDMLRCWTRVDVAALAGPDGGAANAIYVTSDDRTAFGRLEFYLDAEAYPAAPNKYRTEGHVLSDGREEADVEFRALAQSGGAPPDPALVRAHAACARVLGRCGAAQYVECAEVVAEDEALRAERAGLGLRRASRFVVS
ncbi:hypothetical protein HWV62_2005 [Athelia sp. TMB]|nr:hypothetical protein HWV62_2005 [Athelia sp. TMB]